MKILDRNLIIKLLFILIVIGNLIAVSAPSSPLDFGNLTWDGTAIQLYYDENLSSAGKTYSIRVKIPEDEKTLEEDYFNIFIDVRDFNPRQVRIIQYDFVDVKNPFLPRTKQELINHTSELYLQNDITFNLTAGDHIFGDKRFAWKKIDYLNYPTFKQSDEPELFIVEYNDYFGAFYHRTNAGKVILPIQRAALLGSNAFYIGISFICFFTAIAIAGSVMLTVGTWFKVEISTILLVFLTLIVIFGSVVLLNGISQRDLMRDIVVLENLLVFLVFFLSFILGLAAPSFFIPDPAELHIILYNPIKSVVDIIRGLIRKEAMNIEKETVDVGHEKLEMVFHKNQRHYYRNARSFLEILAHILHGRKTIVNVDNCLQYKVTYKTNSYKKPFDPKKEYHDIMMLQQKDAYLKAKIKSFMKKGKGFKSFFHFINKKKQKELLFVKSYHWQKHNPHDKSKLPKPILLLAQNPLYFLMSYGIAAAVLVGFIMIFTIEGATYMTVALLIFLIGYVLYEKTKHYKYLVVEPIARLLLEYIENAGVVQDSENLIFEMGETVDSQRKEISGLRRLVLLQDGAASGEEIVEWEQILAGIDSTSELPVIEKEENQKRKAKRNELITQEEESADGS